MSVIQFSALSLQQGPQAARVGAPVRVAEFKHLSDPADPTSDLVYEEGKGDVFGEIPPDTYVQRSGNFEIDFLRGLVIDGYFTDPSSNTSLRHENFYPDDYLGCWTYDNNERVPVAQGGDGKPGSWTLGSAKFSRSQYDPRLIYFKVNTSHDKRVLKYRWELIHKANDDGTLTHHPRLAGQGNSGKIAVFECISANHDQKYNEGDEGGTRLQPYPHRIGLKMSLTNERRDFRDESAIIREFDEMGVFGEVSGAAVKNARLAFKGKGSFFIALELRLTGDGPHAEGASLNLLCADETTPNLGFNVRHAYIILHSMWMDILHVYRSTSNKKPLRKGKQDRDKAGPSRQSGEGGYQPGYLMLDCKNGNFIYSEVQSGVPPYFIAQAGKEPDRLREYVHIMATDYDGFALEGSILNGGATFRSPGNNPRDDDTITCTDGTPVHMRLKPNATPPIKNNAQHMSYQLAMNYFDLVVPDGFKVSAAACGDHHTHKARKDIGDKTRAQMLAWFEAMDKKNMADSELTEYQAIKEMIIKLSGVNMVVNNKTPAFKCDDDNPIKTVDAIEAEFNRVNAAIQYAPIRYSPYGDSTPQGYQPWQLRDDARANRGWGRTNHPGWTSFDKAYAVITGLRFGDENPSYAAFKSGLPHVHPDAFERTRYWYQGPHSACQCECECKRMRIADGYDHEVDEPLYVISPCDDPGEDYVKPSAYGEPATHFAMHRRAENIKNGRYYIVCTKCAAHFEETDEDGKLIPGICKRRPEDPDNDGINAQEDMFIRTEHGNWALDPAAAAQLFDSASESEAESESEGGHADPLVDSQGYLIDQGTYSGEAPAPAPSDPSYSGGSSSESEDQPARRQRRR